MVIDELKAGRELDALVWLHVMHPEVVSVYDGDAVLMGGLQSEGSACPNYSTDIAAAWQVIEKLSEQFIDVGIHAIGGRWEAEIYDEGEHEWIRAVAPTAHLAICLAALKAVERGA